MLGEPEPEDDEAAATAGADAAADVNDDILAHVIHHLPQDLPIACDWPTVIRLPLSAQGCKAVLVGR